MNIGKLYESMAKDGQESSRQGTGDETNSHSSTQPITPVKVASHNQFHDNIAFSVSQRTH